MEDKDTKEQPIPIIDQVKQYLETYIQLTRLKAIDRGTSVFANIITDVFIILGLSITTLFASITLALYLGEVLHSYWKGFGIVATLFIILIIFVMLFRKSLERPIVNALLKKLFK
jgi:preprotein translocase subunit SecY